MRYFPTIPSVCIALLFFAACDSNEPDPNAGEEEVITHVALSLTNQSNNNTVVGTAVFDEAGVLLSVPTLELSVGATYAGSIQFRNDIAGEDITEEVKEEDEFHQVIYTIGGNAAGRLVISNLDVDGNGDPLGTSFVLTDTGNTTGAGEITVRLRHYEDEAVLPDDKRNDSGTSEIPGVVENDVNVTFPLTIQF